jgi:outer membrane protein, multidrug efflux system
MQLCRRFSPTMLPTVNKARYPFQIEHHERLKEPYGRWRCEARAAAKYERLPSGKARRPPLSGKALLWRRPDVREAEANLIAANARIGEAIAAVLPSIELTGSGGLASVGSGSSFGSAQSLWSLAASSTAPIFEGGRLLAAVEQARAVSAELVAAYESAVLGALRDVENALTDLHDYAAELAAQAAAVRAARGTLDLTLRQYRQGLVSYLQVIDAERTLLSNELTEAQIANQRLASSVLLIKALGGGWMLGREGT